MYGWRAKIGVLIPSRNVVIEPEFYKMAPEGVSIHFARMMREKAETGAEQIERLFAYMESVERGVKELSTADVNFIIFGCTSGSFVGGKDYDKRIIEKIRNISEIPATTATTAVVEAINELEVKRLIVATPYLDDINKKAKEFLEASAPGVKVVNMRGLGLLQESGLLYPTSSYILAKELDTPDADGCFISCTNFRTIDIIQKLENDLQKPVVTANQALMWAALKALKIRDPIKGYGQLLERPR